MLNFELQMHLPHITWSAHRTSTVGSNNVDLAALDQRSHKILNEFTEKTTPIKEINGFW